MITLILRTTADVHADVDEYVRDEADERLAEQDDIDEQDDVNLTPDERKEARVAARIAAREARKADRVARRQRMRRLTRERERLARLREMSQFWGSATWGDQTWYAYTILCESDEVRPLIRDFRRAWEDAKVRPMLAHNPDGSMWSVTDEQGEVDTIELDNQLRRFLGQVQDGTDAEGNPTYRDRRRSDPWIVPNVVAGYALPDLEAHRE